MGSAQSWAFQVVVPENMELKDKMSLSQVASARADALLCLGVTLRQALLCSPKVGSMQDTKRDLPRCHRYLVDHRL